MKNKGLKIGLSVFLGVILFTFFFILYISQTGTTIHQKAEESLLTNNSLDAMSLENMSIATYQNIVDDFSQYDLKNQDEIDQSLIQINQKFSSYSFPFLGFGHFEIEDEIIWNNYVKLSADFVKQNETEKSQIVIQPSAMKFSRLMNSSIQFITISQVFPSFETESQYGILYTYVYTYTTTSTFWNPETGTNYDVDTLHHVFLFGIQDATDYITTLVKEYQTVNQENYIYMISTDGQMYINTRTNETNQTLYSLLKQGNSDNNIDDFQNQLLTSGKGSTKVKLNKENHYFVGTSMFSQKNDEGDYIYSDYQFVLIVAYSSAYMDAFYADLKAQAIIFSLECTFVFACILILICIIAWKAFITSKLTKFNLTHSNTLAMIVDKKGKILFKNRLFMKLDNILYNTLDDFKVLDSDKKPSEYMKDYPSMVLEMSTTTNEKVYARMYITKFRDVYQLIGDVITDEIRQKNTLIQYSYYDDITHSKNRKALTIDLEELLKNIDHNNHFYFLYIDILEFRKINSLFGSETGDQVIDLLVHTLGTIIQPENHEEYYSLGADSAGLLLQAENETQLVQIRLHAIFQLFEKPIQIGLNQLELNIKVGVFYINPEKKGFMTSSSIIEYARLANARSKVAGGKNKYYIYDEGLSQTLERESIMQEDLKNALKNNEFECYFQPQYDLVEDKVIGFEALIRWNNPKYRLDSPLRYIKIAERTGMIHDLGEFVLRQSFLLAKEIGTDQKIHISVNVSPAQLLQTGFIAKFLHMYEEYEVPYSMISIEITETFLMSSLEESIEKLKYIRSFGIKIYLDDFGTGYSSLLYLNNLPIDYIKIDKQFVDGIQSNKSSRSIINKLIAMVNDLNIGVVAEGVEDEYQANFLLKNNCRLIQGWLIGKAEPKSKVPDILKIHKNFELKAKSKYEE